MNTNKEKTTSLLSNKFIPEFAYILGVVHGDGFINVRPSGGTIGLKVKDQDFAIKFKKDLESWSELTVKSKSQDGFYYVNLYSTKFSKIVRDFNVKNILNFNDNLKYHYLRGLFDSDGGIVGNNLNYRRKAKRWIHFSNNNKEIIGLVSNLLKEFGLKHFIKSRIHSGFGSKKIQYEVKIYKFKDIFYFYKNINFCIARKQKRLKEVIESYNYYPKSLFNKAKELHKNKGYRKVAKELDIPKGVVYGWLFKDNQKQILD